MPIITDHSQCIFRMFCLSHNIHDIELSLLSFTREELVKEKVFYARENSVLQSMPAHRPLPKSRHITQKRAEMILSRHRCLHTTLMGK